jgi:predicted DNA-binding ribbon-helix-helix protein
MSMAEQQQQGLMIGVGGLRFNVRYANARTGDRGPSLRIYGDVEGKPVQLLRFDCFENEPHFHYDPEGKNNQLRMDKANVSDPIAWSMDYLRGNITSLVRIAGYNALAEQLDEAVLTAVLPTVEKALRDSVPVAMPGTLEASGLCFAVDYRHTAHDRGPSLQVLGEVDGKRVQLLRFDCFEHEPHFHYDPQGKNNRIFMNTARVSDPIAWSMEYLRGNFASQIRIAGYDKCADRLDEAALAGILPGVEKALRDSVPRG